jgi:putative hydrolase of the HAD superfamily
LPMDAILFVGDDLSNDYDAASAVGMRAVLVDPGERHLGVSNRIATLTEVLRFFPEFV